MKKLFWATMIPTAAFAGFFLLAIPSSHAQTLQDIQTFCSSVDTTGQPPATMSATAVSEIVADMQALLQSRSTAGVTSITGVQGYDAATDAYTTGVALQNSDLILYGTFAPSNNVVLIDGVPAFASYQSATQINVGLAGVALGVHMVSVISSMGASAPASFTVALTTGSPNGSGASTITFPLTVKIISSLNVRPQSNTSKTLSIPQTLSSGSTFTAVAEVVGQNVSGNNLWWETCGGNYIWSGGTAVAPNVPVPAALQCVSPSSPAPTPTTPAGTPAPATPTSTPTGGGGGTGNGSGGSPSIPSCPSGYYPFNGFCVATPSGGGSGTGSGSGSGSGSGTGPGSAGSCTAGNPQTCLSTPNGCSEMNQGTVICTNGTVTGCSATPPPTTIAVCGSAFCYAYPSICTAQSPTAPTSNPTSTPGSSCSGFDVKSCYPANSCGDTNSGDQYCINGVLGACSVSAPPVPQDGCEDINPTSTPPTSTGSTPGTSCDASETPVKDCTSNPDGNACGLTSSGQQTCNNGVWSQCSATPPSYESCSTFCQQNQDDAGCQTYCQGNMSAPGCNYIAPPTGSSCTSGESSEASCQSDANSCGDVNYGTPVCVSGEWQCSATTPANPASCSSGQGESSSGGSSCVIGTTANCTDYNDCGGSASGYAYCGTGGILGPCSAIAPECGSGGSTIDNPGDNAPPSCAVGDCDDGE